MYTRPERHIYWAFTAPRHTQRSGAWPSGAVRAAKAVPRDPRWLQLWAVQACYCCAALLVRSAGMALARAVREQTLSGRVPHRATKDTDTRTMGFVLPNAGSRR